MRGAERHAGLGHAGATRAGERERDPEVGHQRAAVVQQHVLRLDVSMDDAVTMGIAQRAGDLGGDPHGLGDGELLLPAEPVAE